MNGTSDFDGNYRTSTVYGTGGTFPYNHPLLVTNKFENDTRFNIYFKEAGYSGCDDREIRFKFDKDSKIYVTTYVSKDSNSETWFVVIG